MSPKTPCQRILSNKLSYCEQCAATRVKNFRPTSEYNNYKIYKPEDQTLYNSWPENKESIEPENDFNVLDIKPRTSS